MLHLFAYCSSAAGVRGATNTGFQRPGVVRGVGGALAKSAPVGFIVVFIAAIVALGFACRPGYGVAPRVFFALAMAFALAAMSLPSGAAAGAAAVVLAVLGGITYGVDSKRIRIGP